MKIALLITPTLFKRCPLIGVGSLTAYLRSLAHDIVPIDLNIATDYPRDAEEGAWQEHSPFVTEYIASNQPMFQKWAEEILSRSPGLIGFSLWNTTLRTSLELARHLKKLDDGPILVFGGPQVNFAGPPLLEQPGVDILVTGEGERPLAALAERLERGEELPGCPGTIAKNDAGRIVQGPPSPEIENLDTLPHADYTDLPLKKYYLSNTLPLSFNRGCQRRCTFCNIHNDWKSFRSRSARHIFGEMKTQKSRHPDITHFEIDGAALNQDMRQTLDLCDLIIADDFHIGWGGQAFIRPEMGEEAVMEKMARAGCRNLNYGLESGSQKVLNILRKGFTVEHAEKCLRAAHKQGIALGLNVIIGTPGETEEDFQETLSFLSRNRDYLEMLGTPSELHLSQGTEMTRHPDHFGITPGPTAAEYNWRAGDNTREVRLRRVKEFREFVEREKIQSKHPFQWIKTDVPKN